MDNKKLGIMAPLMQSFTSIGPMLDLVAIFWVISIFSGVYLPVVVLVAFLVGFSTINTTYLLSRSYISNGGYYSYVGKTLGKMPGIFVGILYLSYAILVLPDISLFFGSFFTTVFPVSILNPITEQFVVSILFSGLVLLFVSTGLNFTMKYTIIAGLLEFSVIVLVSFLFFTHPVTGFQVYNTAKFNPSTLWLGLIFGIVAFSGSGSSVFFSDNVKKPYKNIPKALFTSYSISGILMVIASLSLVFFLGNGGVNAYISNPFFILDMIKVRFGVMVYYIFIIFSMISSLNLSISYLNALKNGFKRMVSENLFGSGYAGKHKNWHILTVIMLVSLLFETAAFLTNGFFYFFSVAAGTVGLVYITIHIITNTALIQIRRNFSRAFSLILPLISSTILIASFYYSSIDSHYSIYLTNIIFTAIIISGIAAVMFMKSKYAIYSSIHICASKGEFADRS